MSTCQPALQCFFFLSATYRVGVVVGEGHVTGRGIRGSRRTVRGRVIKLSHLSPLEHFEERPDIQGPAPVPCVHARRPGPRGKFSLAVSCPRPAKAMPPLGTPETLTYIPIPIPHTRSQGVHCKVSRRWLCVASHFQRLTAQMSTPRERSKRSHQIRQTLKAALPRHNCTMPLSA